MNIWKIIPDNMKKIPFEVKEKLGLILQKRVSENRNAVSGSGLNVAYFNETTSDMTEYLETFLREELIKYEAHQRIDSLTHSKEFELAEQTVDNYLNPPSKKILSDDEIVLLAKIYGTNNEARVYVAQICDEVLDRSGGLLGKVRDEYRKQLK
jgi:archaellum biogenesis ATPase FlaH